MALEDGPCVTLEVGPTVNPENVLNVALMDVTGATLENVDVKVTPVAVC